jgi:hypothetical protein
MTKKDRNGRTRATAIAGLAAMVLLLPVAACGSGKASSSTPTQPTNPPPLLSPSTAYYVNCAAASNGSGTQTNPWNSLTTPNAVTFQRGPSTSSANRFLPHTTLELSIEDRNGPMRNAFLIVDEGTAGMRPVMTIAREHRSARQAAGYGLGGLHRASATGALEGQAGKIGSYDPRPRKSFSWSVESIQCEARRTHARTFGFSRSRFSAFRSLPH